MTDLGTTRVDLRCAVRTRASGVVPVSTAAPAATHVLLESPLPWPADLAATDAHRAVASAAGPGARVHGVVPRSERAPGEVGVVVHAAPPGPFTRYGRAAGSAPTADVADLVAALVVEAQDRAASPARRDPAVDLLVCGHGSRDRCCGAFGTALATWAESALDVDVWRASHLGGHRFAPTALHLPTGTTWAWLGPEEVEAVVGRTRPMSDLIGHYRGTAAFGHPAGQVLEAEAFARVGWAWLESERDVLVHGEPVVGREWDVEVVGAGRQWRATVVRTGRPEQPVCGQPTTGPKTDATWELVDLVEDVV